MDYVRDANNKTQSRKRKQKKRKQKKHAQRFLRDIALKQAS